MTNLLINEKQLQAQIDELKIQFPDTQDAYREACVLLFFRYGITPTANKLYQYVRKGSMSAPADALNKFWSELRDKSRVRIERSDIPENIKSGAGELIAKLWTDAQKAAQDGFSELIDNATSEILKFKLEAEISRQNLENIQTQLSETKNDLENALKRLSEADYLLRFNTETLAIKEKLLKSLEIDKSILIRQLDETKQSFSRDLVIINESLHIAELRFTSLEKKSLLELDVYRQQIKMSEKSIKQLEIYRRNDQTMYLKEIERKQTQLLSYIEKLGKSHGLINALKTENKLHLKKINSYQRIGK